MTPTVVTPGAPPWGQGIDAPVNDEIGSGDKGDHIVEKQSKKRKGRSRHFKTERNFPAPMRMDSQL